VTSAGVSPGTAPLEGGAERGARLEYRRPVEAREALAGDPTGGPPRRGWRRPCYAIGVPLTLGLLHVALVAPHYFVGSFDDDAGYLLTARALLAGHGLTAPISNGTIVAGSYPPGYPALLVPLLWLWPHNYDPLRLLSVACYAGLFPLTWLYLGRRHVSDGVRVATLLLLALGPPLATFGSMVMAETPFLALLMTLLLLVDRWDRQDRTWTGTGVAVVVAAAGLVWLKEAGVGVVAGLVLWLLLRRSRHRVQRAAMVAAGVIALLLPVVVARLSAGVPLAGSRYSQELGGYYHGGLLDRVIHVAPHALWQMLSTALPATLVPYLTPLPIHGHAPDAWKVLSWHVTLFAVVGAVVWWRRHRDAAIVIVPVYLAETLLWPYVNERRAILVVPVLAAWYVLGAQAIGRAAWSAWTARARRARPGAAPRWGPAIAALLAAALVVVPLLAQLPRDYLVGYGQDTSHFGGSRYAVMLTHLGTPADVVETDYLSSTALFSGHETRNTAFLNTLTSCTPGEVQGALAQDHAGYLLLGDVNKPGLLDSPCLEAAATSGSGSVQLLRTDRDRASVFELVGPGTGHPNLRELTGPAASARRTGPDGTSVFEWDWTRLAPVTQVSLGEGQAGTSTRSVILQVRQRNGQWRTVAGSDSAVGDGKGAAPYLLASLTGQEASGLRAVVTGDGAATVNDVHALGPAAPAAPAGGADTGGAT
jgi:hypothetical protein